MDNVDLNRKNMEQDFNLYVLYIVCSQTRKINFTHSLTKHQVVDGVSGKI